MQGYDEPGSRTRLAWLRTWLSTLAVGVLLLRGLWLAGADWLALALVAGCVLALGLMAAIRSGQLRPKTSPAVPRRMILATTTLVIAMVVLGLAYDLRHAQG